MTAPSDAVRAAAAAIANSRGNRRGAPDIVNVLEMLQANGLKHLYDEVMQDAEAALRAADHVATREASRAALDVLSERQRQITDEGWKPEHDDGHEKAELSRAALQYVAASVLTMTLGGKRFEASSSPPLDGMAFALGWPWGRSWWKPGLVRRMLVKAAALLIAEIERLDRAEGRTDG